MSVRILAAQQMLDLFDRAGLDQQAAQGRDAGKALEVVGDLPAHLLHGPLLADLRVRRHRTDMEQGGLYPVC